MTTTTHPTKAERDAQGKAASGLWAIVLSLACLVGVLHFGDLAYTSATFGGRLGYGLATFAMLLWAGSCFEAAVDCFRRAGKAHS